MHQHNDGQNQYVAPNNKCIGSEYHLSSLIHLASIRLANHFIALKHFQLKSYHNIYSFIYKKPKNNMQFQFFFKHAQFEYCIIPIFHQYPQQQGKDLVLKWQFQIPWHNHSAAEEIQACNRTWPAHKGAGGGACMPATAIIDLSLTMTTQEGDDYNVITQSQDGYTVAQEWNGLGF